MILISINDSASAQIHHEVFLQNTEHELHVYRILGKKPGSTVMMIGGIQGDEPGSYLTADLYADIALEMGNLIVVPRANFYSILLNRREGRTGDMNRKFGKKTTSGEMNMEEEVVAILKHLMAESDLLLNLHEGSGFYAPHWISDMENPRRYGQSIIYDTASFKVPGKNKTLDIESLVKKVVAGVNASIEEKRYHFLPNNHNTLAEESLHKEQQQSATFYALTQAHIPAFGVETSKSISSLETKIRLQKLVINAFMKEFNIIMDAPGFHVETPKLSYVLIRVNNAIPFAVPSGSHLQLIPGDNIVITDIIANYKRGLAADIEGIGTKNDTNIPFRISQSTRIVVRKDAEECGWVDLAVSSVSQAVQATEKEDEQQLQAEQLLVNVDDELQSLTEGQTLSIPKGSRIIIQGIKTNRAALDNDIFVNVKGFAPPKSVNDGNDLNYPIYTGQDLWTRYSENKQGIRFPVEATYHDELIGKFWVELVTQDP